jgi:cyclopropane fatty-acyl-phospholipid synthase-like methyltransferase
MAGQEHFHQAYAEGAHPPWDIGRPQPALIEAGRRGWVTGSVLDVGCGTGEHALYFAAAGCEVVGIDLVSAAIERAQAKAAERALAKPPHFICADVLREPEALAGSSYNTVIDMGFFHTLSDKERVTWRSLLAAILRPGGSYVMVCFSELVPGDQGPRRISETEIRETFGADAGFDVSDLERTDIASNRGDVASAVAGWLTRIRRA